MPHDEDYKPRFAFEISEEQKDRADKLISQYGLRKAIFGPILDDVLDMIESYGTVSIGVMMSKRVRPRDILPTLAMAEEVKSGKP